MKSVHVLGMVALAGALFLAMGASSVSARTGGAAPAETGMNATPLAAPPPAAPLSATPGPSVLPIPNPGTLATPGPGTQWTSVSGGMAWSGEVVPVHCGMVAPDVAQHDGAPPQTTGRASILIPFEDHILPVRGNLWT